MNIPEKVKITLLDGQERELLLTSAALLRIERRAEKLSLSLGGWLQARPFECSCALLYETLVGRKEFTEDDFYEQLDPASVVTTAGELMSRFSRPIVAPLTNGTPEALRSDGSNNGASGPASLEETATSSGDLLPESLTPVQ